MSIESVPNRNSPAAVLLRESCREAGKVRKRTLATRPTPIQTKAFKLLGFNPACTQKVIPVGR